MSKLDLDQQEGPEIVKFAASGLNRHYGDKILLLLFSRAPNEANVQIVEIIVSTGSWLWHSRQSGKVAASDTRDPQI